MGHLTVLLSSNQFWTGAVMGFAVAALLLAAFVAWLIWDDIRQPATSAPACPTTLTASRPATPSPEASPLPAWPRRRGAEL